MKRLSWLSPMLDQRDYLFHEGKSSVGMLQEWQK